jgi:hypothetical protein
MATCPRCGGFLDAPHRCAGVWRLHLRAWCAILLGGIVGALVGWGLLDVVMGQASWVAVTLAGGIGMLVVVALQHT